VLATDRTAPREQVPGVELTDRDAPSPSSAVKSSAAIRPGIRGWRRRDLPAAAEAADARRRPGGAGERTRSRSSRARGVPTRGSLRSPSHRVPAVHRGPALAVVCTPSRTGSRPAGAPPVVASFPWGVWRHPALGRQRELIAVIFHVPVPRAAAPGRASTVLDDGSCPLRSGSPSSRRLAVSLRRGAVVGLLHRGGGVGRAAGGEAEGEAPLMYRDPHRRDGITTRIVNRESGWVEAATRGSGRRVEPRRAHRRSRPRGTPGRGGRSSEHVVARARRRQHHRVAVSHSSAARRTASCRSVASIRVGDVRGRRRADERRGRRSVMPLQTPSTPRASARRSRPVDAAASGRGRGSRAPTRDLATFVPCCRRGSGCRRGSPTSLASGGGAGAGAYRRSTPRARGEVRAHRVFEVVLPTMTDHPGVALLVGSRSTMPCRRDQRRAR
jgi:hypothetical protein